jgi:tetratricopeptide (TPR) repeat protein
VAFYEQTLIALQHLPQSRRTGELAIDLRFDLRASLVPLGEYGCLLDCLRDAGTLAEGLNDRSRLGRVSAYLMNYFLAMGDYDRAIASGQHALALATALEDVALQVKANQRLGRAYMAMGDLSRAIDVLKRNVTSLEGERLWELFGEESPPSLQCRSWLVRCLAMRGEFAEGIARGNEGLRIAEAVDRPFGLIHICQSVGILYRWKGDLHQAIPLLERSFELCKVAHVPVLWPESTSNLGYAYARAGKLAEALPLLEQGVQAATAIGQVTPLAIILAHLSEGYLLAGRSEDASDLARRALALCRDNKQRSFQAGALRLLGEIAAQRDPPDAEGADRHYREALALAEDLGMRPLQAHCHLGLGMLYAETGQREQARAELSAAIEMYHLMEMKFWLPQVEAALAQMEG